MRFDVLTLFPEIFSGYLSQSVLKLAIERGLAQVNLHNIRDWATGRHKVVDDRPYGGGPGMLLKVEPVVESVEAVQAMAEAGHLIMLTPTGRKFTQQVAEELAAKPRLLLLCGRYEGFDDRVRQILQPDEISIGDFILGGGEVAAMTVIDAAVRLVPGVLGDENSARCDSFSPSDTQGRRILEGGHYTRPREYRGLTVPEVLIQGDHAAIAKWRENEGLRLTQNRRQDLLAKTDRSEEESAQSQ
jgi:tRNA (guanine37-N1)-methyltransferase